MMVIQLGGIVNIFWFSFSSQIIAKEIRDEVKVIRETTQIDLSKYDRCVHPDGSEGTESRHGFITYSLIESSFYITCYSGGKEVHIIILISKHHTLENKLEGTGKNLIWSCKYHLVFNDFVKSSTIQSSDIFINLFSSDRILLKRVKQDLSLVNYHQLMVKWTAPAAFDGSETVFILEFVVPMGSKTITDTIMHKTDKIIIPHRLTLEPLVVPVKVIVTCKATSHPPANGYKIELVAGDEDSLTIIERRVVFYEVGTYVLNCLAFNSISNITFNASATFTTTVIVFSADNRHVEAKVCQEVICVPESDYYVDIMILSVGVMLEYLDTNIVKIKKRGQYSISCKTHHNKYPENVIFVNGSVTVIGHETTEPVSEIMWPVIGTASFILVTIAIFVVLYMRKKFDTWILGTSQRERESSDVISGDIGSHE
ncbi:hypothetical protein HELRODRAFT_182034 [Helobdella robusta]|uniref:Uncharacterized protein n=1 Tax=Helobdella robusta TaxID=6412 RepID=T1FHM3_HELRO|nr:hypothetical protein HELRODRAFT_182034 [Helobdella robusta]ESN91857.1 hypothetical protein HELRODRAFT_182034 [Helobdella robusta]